MNTAKPKKKRRMRFGLKLLLLLMAVSSLGLAWFANELNQAKFEEKLIEKFDSFNVEPDSHARYFFDYETGFRGSKVPTKKEPIGPSWIRSLFGQHVFSRITSLHFVGRTFIEQPKIGEPATFLLSNQRTILLDKFNGLQLEELESLVSFGLAEFYELKDLRMLEPLTELESVSAFECKNFESLDGIENLQRLQSIRVSNMDSKLTDISAMNGLNDLELIEIDVDRSFPTQENWDALAIHPNLVKLQLRADRNYHLLRKFRESQEIESDDGQWWVKYGLDPKSGDGIESQIKLGKFRPSPNIEVLTFDYVDPGLVDLRCCREMPKLHRLRIRQSNSLKSLEGLQHCQDLTHLSIEECPHLEDISAIAQLENLISLTITFSHVEVKTIPILICCDIEKLELKGLHGFEDLEFLRHASKLTTLDVTESGLKSLKGLRHLEALQELKLQGCSLNTIVRLRLSSS